MNKPLVIITGASSGIGAAIAKFFSAAGYPLGLLARNVQAMEKLNLPLAHCIATDVTHFEDINAAIKQCESRFGPTDCLINNAGFVKSGDFTELTNQEHCNTVEVNLKGVINGVEVVLPGMQTRRAGTIINVSSVADRNARPQIATYAASKAAVKSLSESLRMANAKYGIRVCNLSPAKIMTPMLIAANLDLEQAISAEELAEIALWIYQQPQKICIRDLVVAPTVYEP